MSCLAAKLVRVTCKPFQRLACAGTRSRRTTSPAAKEDRLANQPRGRFWIIVASFGRTSSRTSTVNLFVAVPAIMVTLV